MQPVVTSHQGTNADLVAIVSAFYIKDGDRVADVTFGKGVFWKKTDTARFKLSVSDLQTGTDFGDTPYMDSSLDVFVLDPPYMHGGASIIKSLNKCYRNDNSSHESVIRLYTKGVLEAARTLKKGGQLWVKTQDEIESGKQRMSSHELTTLCTMLGFQLKDLFVLSGLRKPIMHKKYQYTARKNHSYLLIFNFRR